MVLRVAPSLWCSTGTVYASVGCSRCSGRTSVHICAASLQNLAVAHDLLFPSQVSLRDNHANPVRIRWCATGGFLEQGQCFLIGLSYSIPTIVFYHFSLSFLSVHRLALWGWSLRTDRVSLSLRLALPTFFLSLFFLNANTVGKYSISALT